MEQKGIQSIPGHAAEAFDLEKFRNQEAWSDFLCRYFGEAAAISFIVGSDLVLEFIEKDLQELSGKPEGTHVGQLGASMMKEILPGQFLTRYDSAFLRLFRTTVERIRKTFRCCDWFTPSSVIEEVAIYQIAEVSKYWMESRHAQMESQGVTGLDTWDAWDFDLLETFHVITCLYSDRCVERNHRYHFDHWTKPR